MYIGPLVCLALRLKVLLDSNLVKYCRCSIFMSTLKLTLLCNYFVS